MTLLCKCCNKEKPFGAFSKHIGCISGYDISRCKACKKSKVDWNAVPLNKRIYNRAKSRATKRNIEFNLELEDIILPDKCPVFGTTFIYNDKDYTYSIDRINPSLGYIKGNIMIISNKANRIKNNASVKDLENILKYLKECEIN